MPTEATKMVMSKMRQHPLLTRRQIEGMIAEGHSIAIVDQYVLKMDGWLKLHPGGDKAIMHMIGRDATDEVTALHSPEAREQMKRYRIGRIEGHWKNFTPPIQGGQFRLPGDANGTEANQDEWSDFTKSEASPYCESAPSSSSVPISRDASPVFDIDRPSFSHRRGTTPGSRPTSTTSRSTEDGLHAFTPMGFLDAETKKAINLDLDKYPPLDSETQANIIRKYRQLHERIKAEGLFDCNYTCYAIEVGRYCLLMSGMLFFLRCGWYVLSAVCLGALWHQLVFTVHDAGHMGITHDFHIDTCIGIFAADFIGGLSVGWWKRNHNVHHIITNSPEHDPDIEHMPFLAISHRFFGDLYSTYYERLMKYDSFAKIFLSVQSRLFYIIMLFGRFNLYVLSWDHLIFRRGPRKGPAWWHWWLEIAGQIFFWTWFGYGVLYRSIPTTWHRIVYVLVSHMMQAPVHVQITLSHFAMSTADLGPNESFPQRMLRTTMDVDCPPWLDFFHGGLQFQAIHHLYPRLPRHNLRRTQKLVQEFCNDVGIPYALYGFVDSNKEVIGKLAEVSRQAAILAECQRVVARET